MVSINLNERPSPRDRVKPEALVGDKIQPGHPLFGLIWVNKERVSGAPCFFGTRLPVQSLFDHLAAGDSIEVFEESFPGIPRDMIYAVIRLAASNLLTPLEHD